MDFWTYYSFGTTFYYSEHRRETAKLRRARLEKATDRRCERLSRRWDLQDFMYAQGFLIKPEGYKSNAEKDRENQIALWMYDFYQEREACGSRWEEHNIHMHPEGLSVEQAQQQEADEYRAVATRKVDLEIRQEREARK